MPAQPGTDAGLGLAHLLRVSTLTVGAAAVVAGAVAPFAGCGAVHADCEYGPANPFGLQRKLGCD